MNARGNAPWSGWRIGIAALLIDTLMTPSPLNAATIRLKNRTNLDGDILRVDDEDVLIRLPRQAVVTVDGKPLPSPLVEGTTAPAFAVQDLLGHSQAVGPASGKVTVLHFWVSWCPHCRSDAPKIEALYDRFRDNPKVQVITVNLEDDRTKIDTFVAAHHVAYPVVAAAEQAAAPHGVDLRELYQISGFPVTFVIDERGVIRHKTTGSFVETQVDVASHVTALLAASVSSSTSTSGS